MGFRKDTTMAFRWNCDVYGTGKGDPHRRAKNSFSDAATVGKVSGFEFSPAALLIGSINDILWFNFSYSYTRAAFEAP